MKRKGLLLDRDGVINEERGYVSRIEQFSFREGVFGFLRGALDRGYRLAVVTNQSGVARGYYTQDDFEKISAHMLRSLKDEGIEIDLVLSCFCHVEGLDGIYKRQSFWRKPNAGMILEAALRLDLDLARSVMIGDKASDVEAALSAGAGKALWLGGDKTMVGVHTIRNFDEASTFLV